MFQRPHLWRESVSYNVGLGLRLRRTPPEEIREQVSRVCRDLGIDGLIGTQASTLSGGEAQRVALARALVLDPEVLFLDEPTANLDSEARSDLRADLERIVRARTSSVLLITHDRNEAFRLADRIAVLHEGRLVQVGTPTDLYENPADSYIARMTGAELAIRGRVLEAEGRTLTVDVGGCTLSTVGRVGVGEAAKVTYRPEDLILTPAGQPTGEISTRNRLYATIRERRDLGGLVRLRLDGPVELVALVTRSAAEQLGLNPGARVAVRMKATALHTFPAAADSPAPSPPDASDPEIAGDPATADERSAASGPDDDGTAPAH